MYCLMASDIETECVRRKGRERMFLGPLVRVGSVHGSFKTYEAISRCFAGIYKQCIDCKGTVKASTRRTV